MSENKSNTDDVRKSTKEKLNTFIDKCSDTELSMVSEIIETITELIKKSCETCIGTEIIKQKKTPKIVREGVQEICDRCNDFCYWQINTL